MYKSKLNVIIQRLLTICLLTTSIEISFLTIQNQLLAESKKLFSYTLQFTPPNRGQVSGNGTQKPRRTAARSLGNLQAIVPWTITDPLNRPIHEGHTISSHPVFWLSYNSQSTLDTPIVIDLEIRDTQNNGQNYYYQDSFSLIDNSQSHNFAIKLPQNAPSLESNTKYKWTFIASKDGKIVGQTIGYIERIEIPSEAIDKLSNSNLMEKAEIYAQWGIWHELLNTINQLKQENPDDSRYDNAWNNLLIQYKILEQWLNYHDN